MANLTPVPSLDDVYQLETTDPVQGGPGGISNLPAQQLLNRSQFILQRLNAILNSGGTAVPFAKVEGLGSAAGLNAGVGVGNLMQVGAFGLGGDARQCNDLNNTSQFHAGGFSVCIPGAANAPSGETGFGMMTAWRANIPTFGQVIQQIVQYGSRIYFRQFITDTWGGWLSVTGSNDVGMVSAFALNTPPNGWLRCNGAAVSRTTYSRLFAAIGTTYGAGDGSTTFTLPDLRGQFLRGHDAGANVDPGRAFGSAQGDTLASHAHPLLSIAGSGTTEGFQFASVTGAFASESTTNVGNNGGNETRPKNVAMLYCIKFV
jgi:microcystin-dependent protein